MLLLPKSGFTCTDFCGCLNCQNCHDDNDVDNEASDNELSDADSFDRVDSDEELFEE